MCVHIYICIYIYASVVAVVSFAATATQVLDVDVVIMQFEWRMQVKPHNFVFLLCVLVQIRERC